MKKTLFLTLLASTPLWAERIAVRYTDPVTGADIEEYVEANEGATAETFAPTLAAAPTPAREKVAGFRVTPYVDSDGGATFALVYTRSFSEFRELAPQPRYFERLTAELEAEGVAPEKKGFWATAAEVVKENPWESALTSVAAILAVDWVSDGDVNIFGLVQKDKGSPPEPPRPTTDKSEFALGKDGSFNASISEQKNFSFVRSADGSVRLSAQDPVPLTSAPAK